ncbi:MAG: DEAD/DEAH box helicase [Sphaerochaetaceae bacterium]|nr:DEAD/DEAH box helicase [Sphaerochaetaceae bacterium]
MYFNELPLHQQVLEGTRAANFETCMPVQEKVLPISIEGTDVMVQSKTGSGKTAVYIITFLEKYLRQREKGISSSCLIIAPTRELAQQICDDALILCSKVKGFHIGVFYGGVGYEHQRKQLQMGCDIYVGTPGRLLEFMEHHELDCKRIDTFVIDEADRMFDMGFYPDVKKMFKFLPPKEQRQTLLFSATLEMRVRDLAWEFMKDDVAEIDLEPDKITVDKITQELYHVAKSEKFGLLLQLLAVEKPENALVFTNSKRMAEELCVRLRLNGYSAEYLTGDLPQAQRQKALDNLKDNKVTFLVATDVAARGLQINDLPLVVNYDIPEDYENYVHRIGRTARAGKSGKAISFADEEFVYGLEAIEKYIKMKIPVVWPENLPKVEDASLGKSWKAKPEKPKKTIKTSNPKKKKQYSGTTNTKSLSKMSEAERMAYYRKKYGFEPKKEEKAKVEVKSKKEEEKPKKTSFFKRLFGRKK